MRERTSVKTTLLLLNDNVTLAYEAVRHGVNKLIPNCALANVSITGLSDKSCHLSAMIRGSHLIIEADFEVSSSSNEGWHHRITFVYGDTRHCMHFAPSAAKGCEHLYFECYDEQTPAA